MNRRIRIGTRGSRLALAQTELVKKAISGHFPDMEYETVIVSTKGDKEQKKSISELGGAGVFAKELEKALSNSEIDIAVHSAKDLPTELMQGNEVRCVLERALPGDVIIYHKGTDLLSEGIRVGTSSIRRRTGFAHLFPKAKPCFLDIRGNVDTRIEKLRSGAYDAVILAAAGLERLGLLPFDDDDLCCDIIPPEKLLPAPCQAIIAVESREGELSDILDEVNDTETFLCFSAERYVLRLLGGDCSKPIGAYSFSENGSITLAVNMGGDILSGRCAASGYRGLAEGLVGKL